MHPAGFIITACSPGERSDPGNITALSLSADAKKPIRQDGLLH